MKTALKMSVDDMIAQGMDFSCLGGQRQRYNYFSYDYTGDCYRYHIGPGNFRYFYADQPLKLTMEEVAAEVYPGIGICPYVMTGGTDAKYYKEVSGHCLRFAPLYINQQQYASIHGLNENIYQGALPLGVDFYKKMIEKS